MVLHLCGCLVPSLSAQVQKTMNDCYFAGWNAQLAKLTENTVETRAFSASYTSVMTMNGRPYIWWVETFEITVWPDTDGCVHCWTDHSSSATPVNWWTDAVIRSRPGMPRCSTTPSLTSRVPPPWSTRGRTGHHQPCHFAVVAARKVVAVNDARPHRRRAEMTSAAATARWLLRRCRRVCCRLFLPCCGRMCVVSFSFLFSWGHPCLII